MPSAAAANGLHSPSGDRPRCLLNSTNVPGLDMTVAPPATASSLSPDLRACAARCMATSDDEHAVSIVTAGPSRPSAYAIRPEATAAALPVSRYPSTPGGASARVIP
ncbi:hypothetical protein SGRI78S_06541 [Streptomyces griseus subsp. griseus]